MRAPQRSKQIRTMGKIYTNNALNRSELRGRYTLLYTALSVLGARNNNKQTSAGQGVSKEAVERRITSTMRLENV